jgi:hypothetical protein
MQYSEVTIHGTKFVYQLHYDGEKIAEFTDKKAVAKFNKAMKEIIENAKNDMIEYRTEGEF